MENPIYDQVIEALVGGSYYLDVLLAEAAHGQPGTRLDVQRLSVLRQQQMDAATAFQAWWQTHGPASPATGGPPCPPLTLPPGMHAGGLGWKILCYYATHPGPHHYTTIAKGMRHRRVQSVLNGCVKLAHQGHLRWVSSGVYRLTPQEEKPLCHDPLPHSRPQRPKIPPSRPASG